MTILILISCLSLFFTPQAEEYQKHDEEAVKLLHKVKNKMNSYKSFKLEFNFFIEDLHDASRESYGGAIMYKDGNYKLNLLGQILFTDGKTNWTYLMEADEVNITDNVEEDENTILDPKKLLDDFEQKYKVRLISDRFDNNRPLVEIDLYPIEIDDKQYSRISIRVDKYKHQLYSVRYVGKDGVNYLVEIYRFNENPDITLEDVKFSESKFPDAEIIDMRY